MPVTARWFGPALLGQFSATAARRVDWDTDTIKTALTTSAYAPNQDTHDFFDDVTNEVVGTGYTAGGYTHVTAAPVYDGTSNTLRLDADDATWAGASFTARYAVIYKSTGTAATSPLLGYIDFGADETVSSGTFTVVFDATDGALRIVAS